MIHPVRRLDRWIDGHHADDLPHAVRLASADQLRRLAGALWDRWGLGEIRYFSELDYALVRVVNAVDNVANLLDKPW